jgi:geranylgeranyl pyrophosphate synthase
MSLDRHGNQGRRHRYAEACPPLATDGMSADPITTTDPAVASGRLQELQIQVLEAQSAEARIPNPLLEVGQYAVSAPGKMLRGRMLLESCRAVSGDPERVLWSAVGTEFGHLASLIHDDVIDRDEIRRGRPSVWGKFGGDAAIVGGDLLIFEAYYCLSQCRGSVPSDLIVRALEVTSKSCIDLCLGQALELHLTGDCSASTELYWSVVRGKTASLFRGACESGSILGGGTEAQILAMRGFGEAIGLAFQVVDDLLPYVGTVATLGKPVVSDIRNRRVTLPILYALEDATERDADVIRSLFGAPHTQEPSDRDHEQVVGILQRSGAIRRAEDDIERLYQEALTYLLELPPSPGRDALAAAAAKAVDRAF